MLIEHFSRLFSEGDHYEFSSEVTRLFRSYSWPGNVRELINTVKHAIILAGRRKRVECGDLPTRIKRFYLFSRIGRGPGGLKRAVLTFEREFLKMALAENGGNRTRTAKVLGLSRQSLVRKIGLHGLRGEGDR